MLVATGSSLWSRPFLRQVRHYHYHRDHSLDRQQGGHYKCQVRNYVTGYGTVTKPSTSGQAKLILVVSEAIQLLCN